MSLGHDFQELVGPKGSVIKACRFCVAELGTPKASQACVGNTLPMMPPSNGPTPNELMNKSIFPPPLSPKPVSPMSAIEVIKSLDTALIEAKMMEMRGEIAGLEVLLAAARARDLKAEKSS